MAGPQETQGEAAAEDLKGRVGGKSLSGTHMDSQPEVPEEEGNLKPQGVRKEPKEVKADVSSTAITGTDARARKELQEVVDMCDQAQTST